MKLRVLNYRVNADHEALVTVDSCLDRRCFSDFDAIVCDPVAFIKNSKNVDGKATSIHASVDDDTKVFREALGRHAREFADLLTIKGGVGIFFLRPNVFRLAAKYYESNGNRSLQSFGPYFLLDAIPSSSLHTAIENIESGNGTTIVQNNSTTTLPYFQILKGRLAFEAAFSSNSVQQFGNALANDSVGRAVAVQVRVGKGFLLFLPLPVDETEPKRLGAAVIETIRLLSVPSSDLEEAPQWAASYPVPTAEKFGDDIAALEAEREAKLVEINALKQQRAEITRHQHLLFGSGKHVLEPAVRSAFRLLGFSVAEPDTYSGEWDVEMSTPDFGRFIGEVEGPEGAVDLDKFRQLLQYHNEVMLDGYESKGVLIGNAYRLKDPSERGVPFTEHAIRSALKTGFALIPTTELFKAVCLAFSGATEAELIAIRKSMFDCIGIWQLPEFPISGQ